MIDSNCPLCQSNQLEAFFEDQFREYLVCNQCKLIHVPKLFHLSHEKEKMIYDQHQNNHNDPGYRKFLSRTLDPLFTLIPPPAKGLDFGSGPGPTVQVMGNECGYDIDNYDPIYSPNFNYQKHHYHFITLTEVIEHIAHPAAVITNLLNQLKPNGLLAIMTKRWISKDSFVAWHYKNDPTHICFYHRQTFDFMSVFYNLELSFIESDVVFFRVVDPQL